MAKAIMGWPVYIYNARDFEANADPLPELVPASFVPHTASHIVHPSVPWRTSGRRFWRNGSWWLRCFFLGGGSWRRWKPKSYQSVKGEVFCNLDEVYLGAWLRRASCIWLKHVLASSSRSLCFLSWRPATHRHVVHKLWLEGLAIACCFWLGNIQEILDFIRLANSCLMSKDPAARHFYIYFLHFWILRNTEQDATCKVHTKSKCIGNATRLRHGMSCRWGDSVVVHFLVVSACNV